MKKSLLIMMMALFSAGVLSAQDGDVKRLHGFSGGANNESNTTIVLGQAFAFQGTDGDFEVCVGVAEAQLDREMMDEVTITPDQDYNHPVLGLLTAPVAPGDYNTYVHYTDHYNYDSVYIYRVNLLDCKDPVADADGNEYEVVGVAGLCWTKSNLKAQHYLNEEGEIGEEIPVALVYNMAPDNNEDANLEDFGRLYNWYSAVNLPEGSSTALADGYVQGICPDGWHIPTLEEMQRLQAKPAKELKEVGEQYWLTPNDNDNASDFSARGAGKGLSTGASAPTFMLLRGWTNFWTVEKNESSQAYALELRHFCAEPVLKAMDPQEAVSVRCVRTENAGE